MHRAPACRWVVPIVVLAFIAADRAALSAPSFAGDGCVMGYRLTDLGTLGGPSSQVGDISESGIVVGNAFAADGQGFATMWVGGEAMSLGGLGGGRGIATGINALNAVVGQSATVEGTPHAFLWENGVMTDLGTLGGATSRAVRINDRGQIAGESATATVPRRAFLYDAGRMIDLGTFGGQQSGALGINQQGTVVGFANDADEVNQPFAWTGGDLINLGTAPGFQGGVAVRINDRGDVIGWVLNVDAATGMPSTMRAALWRDGAAIDLGTLGGRTSMALGLNELGHVVGAADIPGGGAHGFIWTNGALHDLNDLVRGATATVISALAINARGQVAVNIRAGDAMRAGLLTPTPCIPAEQN